MVSMDGGSLVQMADQPLHNVTDDTINLRKTQRVFLKFK